MFILVNLTIMLAYQSISLPTSTTCVNVDDDCNQLTTRAVEKDPLRNRVPHFLCGSITEEDSTLTMYTPLPDIPFPMKKSLNEWATAPRTIRGFLSVSNQEKRAKESKGQTSNQQTLGKL